MNPHFAPLVLGLAHQAESAVQGPLPADAEGMGDPRTVARTLIDTLGMLAEKTAGGRFRFVQTMPRA